jgi:nitrite reductase/ring-hydroxylating ferredoxin subunit
MTAPTLKRNFFQRLLGLCATRPPADPGCWSLSGTVLTIDLQRAPELEAAWGAIRLEGRGLPERILLVKTGDRSFQAFRNRCTHAGRRLDPMPGTDRVQCCSVGRSTFDGQGARLAGPARNRIVAYPLHMEGQRLHVDLTPIK